jgi:hypothetical protein
MMIFDSFNEIHGMSAIDAEIWQQEFNLINSLAESLLCEERK